ncbi:ester cyclase [Paraburkholderia bengalensis]|uniref:Ester cyclase n=1 Tax=Paraburkholderia bengalensis TaxID=2747562 RepID=A0ABU8IQL4_9BURK
MTSSSLIEKFLTGWSNDLPALMTLFTEDVAYHDKPLQAELSGKEELKNFAQAFFDAFPDIRFSLAAPAVLAENRAAFEWNVTGTHKGRLLDIPASNRAIDFMGVSVMEFRDGLISRTIDYWDLATLLRQIGHTLA